MKRQGQEQQTPAKRLIPEDWRPDAKLQLWAAEMRPDLDLSSVAESFRDHYLATGEVRADWGASFRTWVKRERASTVPVNPAGAASFRPYPDADETARMLAARDRGTVPPPSDIRELIHKLRTARRTPTSRGAIAVKYSGEVD